MPKGSPKSWGDPSKNTSFLYHFFKQLLEQSPGKCRFGGGLPALRGELPVDPGRLNLGSRGGVLALQSRSRSDPKIHRFFDRFLISFLTHVGSQNDSQNHPKSIKNRSKNEFDQKNWNFWKIALRLHQKLTFEGLGSQKPSKHLPNTIPKPIKNPTKNSIDF